MGHFQGGTLPAGPRRRALARLAAAGWKTGLDSSMNSIRLIHIEKHARFHLRVSACVVIVIGDNLGKRLGYGLRDISGD